MKAPFNSNNVQAGFSMPLVLIAVAGTALLLGFFDKVMDQTFSSHKRNVVLSDLEVARNLLSRGDCNRTKAYADSKSINCAGSSEQIIRLLDGDGAFLPPVYRSNNTAQLFYLRIKTVCQNNKVRMLYSRVESDGTKRKDLSSGLSGQWDDAFPTAIAASQPFREFPCP